jgi:hypothetical protein
MQPGELEIDDTWYYLPTDFMKPFKRPLVTLGGIPLGGRGSE